MIKLEVFTPVSGDNKIFFEDTKPEERAEFAKTVTELLKQGHAIFLIQGPDNRRITGYDPKTNDWLVQVDLTQPPEDLKTEAVPQGTSVEAIPAKRGRGRQKKTKRVPASGSKATAVGMTAGG